MPSFSFDEGSIPTREELKRLLEEIRQQSNPVEDLIDLTRTLARLEEKYGMTSAEFFEKFSRGEMGDNVEMVKWAGHYHMYLDLKRNIELSLEQVLA